MNRTNNTWILFALGLVVLFSFFAKATETRKVPVQPLPEKSYAHLWDKIEPSTLWYLSYGFGEEDGSPYNKASIGRGYMTLKYKPVKWFGSRITFDAHQDDSGDMKVRLKYLYCYFFLPKETDVISDPSIEFGLVHTPWFAFEEYVNKYRMQGTMFIERNHLLNSADMGVTIGALIGGKLSKEVTDKIGPKYPGKFGSFAVGLYNGGGYHAKETNQNKVFMSRISVRPLGPLLPNLQLSHLLINGKGNTEEEPEWLANNLMLSFEHRYFTLTGQYATGMGNQKGEELDSLGQALSFKGFSVFAEFKWPEWKSSLMGRFDRFEWDPDGLDQERSSRLIVAYGYRFYKTCMLVLDYDRIYHHEIGHADWTTKLTLRIEYR
jgi:hypothetical protein